MTGVKKNNRAKDLRGCVFKHLTVIDRSNLPPIRGSLMWECFCSCGEKVVRSSAYLVHGKNPSCGCSRYENTKGNITHGLSKSSEYKTWSKMKERCLNRNDKSYPDYGGRGIRVCERWIDSFENFLQDMGERPDKECSVDRLDVNGNYTPENCKWSSRFEQAQNKRKLKNNSSGKTGVKFEIGRGNKHWVAEIRKNNQKRKKRFEFFIDAVFQRMQWEQELYGFCKI